MGRLMKDLKSGKLDQITAKAYLDQNVFGMLENSLNHLLETIERNGEFEKYVEMLADRQEREQRELRRRAREMKRLELGDDYQSSDTEESDDTDEDKNSYGEESYGLEVMSSVCKPEVSKFNNSSPLLPRELLSSPLRKEAGLDATKLDEISMAHTINAD